MNSASGVRFRVEGDEPVETVEEIRHVHRGPPKQPQFLCVSLIDVTGKPLREEDRRLSAARRHHQDVAPAEQYVLMESKFLRRGTRRPDVRSLRRVVANTPGHVSPANGIQNPCPVGERNINALLPKRRAELGRKLIQHGLDGRIGEMTEVRVNRFARE